MDLDLFIQYCKTHIKGDEKGESQIFLDHFFTALGYVDGLKGAGAECEFRIRDNQTKSTSFADLVWKPRVLIEMKKRNEDLSIHYQQAFSYWLKLVPNRPKFVILCNFDEFWIYDFDLDIYEPQEKILLKELNVRKEAISFLFPIERKPLFKSDREDVTVKVAYFIAVLFKSLVDKNRNPTISREIAMHYSLQCVLCLFAEDVELLPNKIFSRIIGECMDKPGTGYDKVPETYDLLSGLFHEMNTIGVTDSGRFKGVDYFNGGLFQKIQSIELTKKEVELLDVACTKNWKHINPAIFGTIFEQGLEKDERHILGAHYTHETDIKRIVDPVLVQPWKEKIDEIMDSFTVKTKNEVLNSLFSLHSKLINFTVLDPACGSGNFLFIAYKEMKLLEKEIFKHISTISTKDEEIKYFTNYKKITNYVSTKQFYGIDINPFAIEIARVTLMIAKELSIQENSETQDTLPLDNLNSNIVCADALFTDWPKVDVIIGNPPYQSKRNMVREFGAQYVNDLLKYFKNKVPGRADFCVYWFYKSHNNLKKDGYAGLVATNSITQNYSREGSIDYIANNGGDIYNAVSSTPWSGEAVVFVSIVCWKKGIFFGEKELYVENGANELELHKVDLINTSLSLKNDVVNAKELQSVKSPKKVFQGQIPGLDGYLVAKRVGLDLLKNDSKNKNVVKPHLIADELIGNINSQPERFMIDFSGIDILEASTYIKPFNILKNEVLPERMKYAEKQELENKEILKKDPNSKTNKHHISFLKKWWQPAYGREDMLDNLKNIEKYIACSGVSKRNIFEFISSDIIPNAAVFAFMFEDDYSFGIIQSFVHWEWWKARCSTLKGDFRYTSNTVWDTFPWPQNVTEAKVRAVAKAAKNLYVERFELLKKYNISLRELYRIVEQPGNNALRDLHNILDQCVLDAYGFSKDTDLLAQLLKLNQSIFEKENSNKNIQSPGLPSWVKNKEDFISDSCVTLE